MLNNVFKYCLVYGISMVIEEKGEEGKIKFIIITYGFTNSRPIPCGGIKG